MTGKKAQIHFEAILAFLFLIGFLGIALAGVEKQKQGFLQAENISIAEANAQECALLANALFSSTETSLKKTSVNCFAGREFEIKSLFKGEEKSAFCIAKQVKTTQAGGRSFLEVKTSEHYR
ncbi:MAG: hypothetical protein PHD95_02135 [Candidatus ainarchaeum sp.]|nr:hypothetical protein [Candidatus ainarchaeum sp.]